MNGLSVRGLTLAAPGKRPDGAALPVEDVSFSAARGALTAVLGGAGAGKTLLFAGIAGLVPHVRGAVFLDGADISAARDRRRRIGMLKPGTDLGAARTLAASLRLAAGRARKASPDAPGDLLQAFGLAARANYKLAALSHGEGFGALAMSRLVPEGDVLLVDEAGTGLDAAMREALLQILLAEAAKGRAVVLATRHAGLALQADHLVLLRGGQVVQAGPPALIYAEPRDAASASLTGPCNILRGTVRQKMPGGFIWASAGGKFTHSAHAGSSQIAGTGPGPALGGAVSFCLRPELLNPLTGGNTLSVIVTRIACLGGTTALHLGSAMGPLIMHCPRKAAYWPGQSLTVGWDAGAPWLLRDAASVTQSVQAEAAGTPRMTVA